jgi:putative membrane protein
MTADPSSLPAATKLAVDRTRLAYERTLMAWVRTATSLISFGFTIYKFFQYLHQDRPPADAPYLGPRGFALLMISIGLVALTVATIEHRQNMNQLRAEYGPSRVSVAAVVAGLIAILGLAGLVSVLFHM